MRTRCHSDPDRTVRTICRLAFGGLAAALIALAPVHGQEKADAFAPEIHSGHSSPKGATAQHYMIAAANPLAVRAGEAMLAAGGTAVDAMVATQLVLGLVEPQSSGLGGGAFLVHFDENTERLTTLDGRETAPMNARPTLFQDENGEPLQFFDAVVGGRSVGTPGTVALMWEAHQRHGKLPWADLFQPAIKLAEDGFAVSNRLATLIADDVERLSRHEATRSYFLIDGTRPLPEGHILKNPAYAETLRAIASGGAKAFYHGAIAEAIVEVVRHAPGNPGVLSLEDLSTYRVKERPPVCVDYREFDICGMGPPSSGAVTIGQILGMIEPFDIAGLGPTSGETWRIIGDASRLAFADRGRYLADTDHVPAPISGLLDPGYIAVRSSLLRGDTALGEDEVEPGEPEWDHAMRLGDDQSLELPSTSHMSIVDSYGNAVSLTTTIENAFGARLMVRGFLLNNELTDFSFATHNNGVPIANRVAPGKRPRSSMSPTIALKDGAPAIIVGSPGGSRIIGYVVNALINHIDWGMEPAQAVAMPHLVNRFGTFDLEAGTMAEELAGDLAALGFAVNIRNLNSGLHMIAIDRDGDNVGLSGGADPRREGIVAGQ